MPRQLEKCNDNEYHLLDPRTGEEVVFSYRSPTTEDRVRHQTRRFGRKGNKMIARTRTACIETAASVLTGIRATDFVIGDQPLSSIPDTPGYREDWKELIVDMAGDLLLIMGHDLFEQKISVEMLKGLEILDESNLEEGQAELEDKEEEIPPLATSSGV